MSIHPTHPRLLIGLLTLLCIAPMSPRAQPLETVPFVDLNRYTGTWYEIASFPQSFQKGCCGTTATYTLSEKGYVVVENACFRNSLSGKRSYIKGKAFVDRNSGNAKLRVQFFWPIRGKYWIIELDDNYEWAAVSHPNRKYLWILSRTPHLDDATYAEILERLERKGLQTSRLMRTPQ